MKQYIPFLLLYLLLMPLYYWMKPYPLRKWTGLAMGLAGLLWILFLPPYWAISIPGWPPWRW